LRVLRHNPPNRNQYTPQYLNRRRRQPGMTTSIGSTLPTPPQDAELSPKTPPLHPQSPTATTSFGSGTALFYNL